MRPFPAALQRLATIAVLGLSLPLLDACSGAVSGPAPTPTPSPITVTPSTATVYSNLPSTFVVTGGNGSYIVNSSNQAIVPSILSLTGNGFTIVPNDVSADTPITLTVQDTASDIPATAALTVKPRTINNVVAIIPSASQSTVCGTAICAGGDAEVKAVLSQGGVPLPGRAVTFDVISGDFRIINSAPGLPEQLSLSGTATTDNTGAAVIRIRVLSDASAQTGLLRITDVSSGFAQTTGVSIAPSSNAPLNAQPSTIVFQGIAAGTCASGISADVIVFGGRPPYLISQPGSFGVNPTVITNNGGRFTVTAIGQCTSGSQIAIVDANGATVSVTASNKLSDLVVATPTPTPTTTPLVVSPTDTSLATCNDVATVSLTGGAGTYIAASGNGSILAAVSGNIGSIRRGSNSSAPGTSTVTVQFSDGKSSVPVIVHLSGEALGSCPPPTQFTVSPTTASLTTCNAVANVTLSGGSGTYVASSGNSSVRASVLNNVGSISRVPVSSAPGASTVIVQFSDGMTTLPVTVSLSGEATGSCPASTTPGTFTISPTSVILSSCTDIQNVVVSGGSGSYQAVSSDTGINVTGTNGFYSVQRKVPSPAIVSTTIPPASVTFYDGSSTQTLGVFFSGTGAGACS